MSEHQIIIKLLLGVVIPILLIGFIFGLKKYLEYRKRRKQVLEIAEELKKHKITPEGINSLGKVFLIAGLGIIAGVAIYHLLKKRK